MITTSVAIGAASGSVLLEESSRSYEHMFEQKRNLTPSQTRLYKQFSESYCISLVLAYLGQR